MRGALPATLSPAKSAHSEPVSRRPGRASAHVERENLRFCDCELRLSFDIRKTSFLTTHDLPGLRNVSFCQLMCRLRFSTLFLRKETKMLHLVWVLVIVLIACETIGEVCSPVWRRRVIIASRSPRGRSECPGPLCDSPVSHPVRCQSDRCGDPKRMPSRCTRTQKVRTHSRALSLASGNAAP
jgi:hypothetical protein